MTMIDLMLMEGYMHSILQIRTGYLLVLFKKKKHTVECRYSSTNLNLGKLSGQPHAPGALPHRDRPPRCPLDTRPGAPESVWTPKQFRLMYGRVLGSYPHIDDYAD
jgi:hypothetical protein